MTQNMNQGSDLTYVVGALTNAVPDFSLADAVDLTYAELLTSNFSGRAATLADKISSAKPDILTLQEAALWRTGPTIRGATDVLADQIQLLQAALRVKGTPYDVVAVNIVNDIAVPGSEFVLRLTDRDAVLVRSDLRPPKFNVSDVHTHIFRAALTIPGTGLGENAGWIEAIIHVGNKHFRLLTTHLRRR